ncbi:MAG: hypothetical protein EPN30_07305 [Actinomycetota bacterium]|nr:MAG: hypothetical protein EPN30_07305 [Actinomycetota bacterium]
MLARRKRKTKKDTQSPNSADAPLHQLVASEVVLLTTVLVCTIMIWNDKVNIYGISYFGVTTPTLPVVAVGFVVGSWMLIMASSKLPNFAPYGLVKFTLRVVSVGIVLLLLTPYTLDAFFNWTHMILGGAIFAVEMYTGTVLCFKYLRDRVARYALALQFLGGILAMFSLPDNMLNFMLEGEVIFQLGFMVLLNHLMQIQPSTAVSPLSPET